MQILLFWFSRVQDCDAMQFQMIQNQVIYEAEEEYEHIICGAGLVGVLWALYLRRRSESIAIFQKCSDIREELVWGGRSINMMITKKALDALQQLGIKQLVLSNTKPLKGKMIHFPDGTKKFLSFSNQDNQVAYCIQRKVLNQVLLSIAENNNIGVYFGYGFLNADLNDNKFIFENQDGKIAIRGTYLYGADGAGSEVRKNMFQYNAGFTKAEWFDTHYKQLFVPANEQGGYQIDEDCLHIWPRGKQMMMGMPNPNGSFSLTLFLPAFGEKSFQQLNNEEKMRQFLSKNFPDVFELIPNPVQQIFSNPVGVLGTLFCSSWSFKDRCVLLGDAAHTLLPFFSQAMNSGYYDCYILDRLIDEHGFDGAFQKFPQVQKPHSDIMARMAIDHFVDLSARMLDPKFFLQREAERVLMKSFPKFRSKQKIIMFGNQKYREAYLEGEKNNLILKELLKGVETTEQIDLKLAKKLIESGATETGSKFHPNPTMYQKPEGYH